MNENQTENIEQEVIDTDAIKAQIKEQAKNASYDAPYFGAVAAFFKNFANFKGRSSRREYWWFTLIATVVGLIFFKIPFPFILKNIVMIAFYRGGFTDVIFWGLVIFHVVLWIAFGIPSFAMGARRFRDVDRPQWTFWFVYGTWAVIAIFRTVRNFLNLYATTPAGTHLAASMRDSRIVLESLYKNSPLLSMTLVISIVAIACLPTKPFEINGNLYDNQGKKVK